MKMEALVLVSGLTFTANEFVFQTNGIARRLGGGGPPALLTGAASLIVLLILRFVLRWCVQMSQAFGRSRVLLCSGCDRI